jgi:hypothetical protein
MTESFKVLLSMSTVFYEGHVELVHIESPPSWDGALNGELRPLDGVSLSGQEMCMIVI